MKTSRFIAFDGNVYTGKTSIINALASIGNFSVINEHSSFLEHEYEIQLIETGEDARIQQSKYLDAEIRRMPKTQDPMIYLVDRSYVSMAAHVTAMKSVFGLDIREWFFGEVSALIQNKRIIVPDVYCHINCCSTRTHERFLADQNRRTESFYRNEKYLVAVNEFNHAWSHYAESISINTDMMSPDKLAEEFMAFRLIHTQNESSTDYVCKCLREILFMETISEEDQ